MAQGYYGTESNPLAQLHSERVVLTPHTSGEPDQYGMRLRTDLDSGDRIATVLVNNGTVGEAPVFPDGTSTGSGVAEGPPVYVPGEGWGFVPLGDTSAFTPAYEEFAFWHNSTRYGWHNSLFALPDNGDLHARYSAKDLSLNDGETVAPWPDATGNGHDLTAGTAPTFKTNVINGNPVVRFDGADDLLDVAFSAISQPFHIWVVGQMQSIDGDKVWVDSETDQYAQLRYQNETDEYDMYAGVAGPGHSAAFDTPVIRAGLFDGSSSVHRQDGNTTTGDASTNSLNGFTVGANRTGGGQGSQLDIGEILIFPMDKSGIASDVDSYLDGEWGPIL